jgi:hypothetical protein
MPFFIYFFPPILSVIASYSFSHFLSDDTILHFTYSRTSCVLYKFFKKPLIQDSVFHVLLKDNVFKTEHGFLPFQI